MKLFEITNQFAALNALEDCEDLPDQVLADTLEGLEGDLQVKAQNIGYLIGNLEATAEAIEGAAKAMSERANRVRSRAERIKAYTLFCLQAAGIRKVECPQFTMTVRENPPSVKLAEGIELPPEYLVQPDPPPPRPDRKKLADALKAGTVIDGAWLERGEHLVIKT